MRVLLDLLKVQGTIAGGAAGMVLLCVLVRMLVKVLLGVLKVRFAGGASLGNATWSKPHSLVWGKKWEGKVGRFARHGDFGDSDDSSFCLGASRHHVGYHVWRGYRAHHWGHIHVQWAA